MALLEACLATQSQRAAAELSKYLETALAPCQVKEHLDGGISGSRTNRQDVQRQADPSAVHLAEVGRRARYDFFHWALHAVLASAQSTQQLIHLLFAVSGALCADAHENLLRSKILGWNHHHLHDAWLRLEKALHESTQLLCRELWGILMPEVELNKWHLG
eukprot:CAMPEP_0197648638 /NCGR_PEP_ID=MMETSP1338-20131121/27878_1 /TAXON_ID=43686 ORGANISM="Pelagodinium beii, Strain RCC1491" /NCGR_SAMPLE_ID=MMETSP1338 /ASSEMBLY_ACC=CAM_ASM_000754 /LENGTH=160 /DNA_ID=CAMNT_0043222677 /DNA_START=77 /DNA_END=561 /DNA_ORIENTATION=-